MLIPIALSTDDLPFATALSNIPTQQSRLSHPGPSGLSLGSAAFCSCCPGGCCAGAGLSSAPKPLPHLNASIATSTIMLTNPCLTGPSLPDRIDLLWPNYTRMTGLVSLQREISFGGNFQQEECQAFLSA